ncbi:MAG: T9SS type A sorting domain-containing protein [Bacteroidota bacterium]|nr:T9SS type A sorting domain-containing protein [Bacteroidota bacterium]MXW14371.1 T9SS type A sorting domain-containing protein [Rhodothermaceae bacterium]MCY3628812.1 T9SS type A sorting domain-containing protein [Bacteroidota bacterium]MDE2644346.1 T9SS type A sorting domain-containing protein [Bacteroidota bacterium]MXW32809.1 T9SS type A sorting domain-containing protein [Rhodothermaceae bacterium]
MHYTILRFFPHLLVSVLAVHCAARAPQAQAVLDSLNTLKVEPENWCTDYDRSEYSSGVRDIEQQIVEKQGGMFSPYDGMCFESLRESDIEHIVAVSEAHSSGMCARSNEEKRSFDADLLNLTLAEPYLNRYQKIAKDFAEWQPDQNVCWYAARIVDVKSKYDLTIDQAEKDALAQALNNCIDSGSTLAMEVPQCSIGTSVENAPRYAEFRVPTNYPNPITDHTTFVIDSPVQTVVSIQLLDVLGREVLSLPNVSVAAGKKQYIRLTELDIPPGIYLYQIMAESGASKTGKLVKK